MTKEKDPAFLFYSKDWIEGTMEMTAEEKGVFIDLLCHQHQRKGLPTETRRLAKLCGLSESEFLPVWVHLKAKFYQNGDQLYNQKLTKVVTERETKSKANRIAGVFASVIRISTEKFEVKDKIKKIFKIDAFLTVPDQSLTETITKWYQERLKSIEDGNGNGNGNKEDKNRGTGERKETINLKTGKYAGKGKSGFTANGTFAKDANEPEEAL